MLSCTSSIHHHISLSPFCFLNVIPSTFLAVLFSISAVLSHSSGNPSLPTKILVTSYLNLSKRFFIACLLQFSPSYIWVYFLCLFFFTIRAIFHSTLRCCFATHSFTITLQLHISFRSLLLHITYSNLFGCFFRHFYTLPCVFISS